MAEHLEAPKSTEGMTYIYKYYFINLIKVIYWITFKDPQIGQFCNIFCIKSWTWKLGLYDMVDLRMILKKK